MDLEGAVREADHERGVAAGLAGQAVGRCVAGAGELLGRRVELVAETTAYSVCASSGIDPGEFSITYLAGWSERTPIATIERTAALIDRLSRRIEDAVADVTPAESDDDAAPQLRDADPAASEAGLERLQVVAGVAPLRDLRRSTPN